ncbi:MAG: 30S ribosomal protein S6 [Gemmatimonadetes bacterium]|nr:30S ribosomal protein S6 [Gemmatimonadota bacterium]
MRDYEVVYLFDPQLAEEQIGEKLGRFNAQLTDHGGEITATDDWGRRQLAFPIRKNTVGHYTVVQFRAPSAALPEFERLIKLDEGVLRYLVVLHEGEPTAPMSLATRQVQRDEDDEDREDGED